MAHCSQPHQLGPVRVSLGTVLRKGRCRHGCRHPSPTAGYARSRQGLSRHGCKVQASLCVFLGRSTTELDKFKRSRRTTQSKRKKNNHKGKKKKKKKASNTKKQSSNYTTKNTVADTHAKTINVNRVVWHVSVVHMFGHVEVRRRRKEGRKAGRQQGNKAARQEGRKAGREEGRKEGRKGGRKEEIKKNKTKERKKTERGTKKAAKTTHAQTTATTSGQKHSEGPFACLQFLACLKPRTFLTHPRQPATPPPPPMRPWLDDARPHEGARTVEDP